METGSYVLPTYAWNETVIKDILGPEVKGISDMVIINPGECPGLYGTAFQRPWVYPGGGSGLHQRNTR